MALRTRKVLQMAEISRAATATWPRQLRAANVNGPLWVLPGAVRAMNGEGARIDRMRGDMAHLDASNRDRRRAPRQHDQPMSEESSQPVRILVVDDDPSMRQMVVNYIDENNM